MMFAKVLRDRIRRGKITCSIRIWTRPHVKVGGWYRMDDGHVVVDSIVPITLQDITDPLARESGFNSREELIGTAKHGKGNTIYLIRFHYERPGAWELLGPKRRRLKPRNT